MHSVPAVLSACVGDLVWWERSCSEQSVLGVQSCGVLVVLAGGFTKNKERESLMPSAELNSMVLPDDLWNCPHLENPAWLIRDLLRVNGVPLLSCLVPLRSVLWNA